MKPIIVTESGSSNLSKTIQFSGLTSVQQWELDEFKFHLATAATAANNLTVTQRSKYGAAYDCVIFTQAMASVQDVFQQWERPVKMNGKDRVVFAWTNDAASFKTYGLTVNCKV